LERLQTRRHLLGRAAALLALAAALVAWYATVPHLGGLATWPSVLIVSLVLMPALFAVAYLMLPLREDRRLLFAVAALAIACALAFSVAGWQLPANFAKFVAMTTVGWSFLLAFEALSWVVAVALIIPWVDAYSVWRGPTKAITTHHAAVFTNLSVAFVVPGGGAARLGLPDVMFFAVFLGASVRWGLRPLATWAAMTAGLGITMVLTTVWAVNGLPALPGISLGFLLANADLLWRRFVRPPHPSLEASPGG
jgi:hypothetical protein